MQELTIQGLECGMSNVELRNPKSASVETRHPNSWIVSIRRKSEKVRTDYEQSVHRQALRPHSQLTTHHSLFDFQKYFCTF
jgi:hypothetical protein